MPSSIAILEGGIELATTVIGIAVFFSAYHTVSRMTFSLYRRAAQTLAVTVLLAVIAEVVAMVETIYYPSTMGDVFREFAELTVISGGGLALYFMRRAEREEVSALRKSANTDELTGLSSRAYFRRAAVRRLELSLRNDIPVCCVLLDVDDFKSYNDLYGHGAGDQALACVARMLSESARADDLACRYGGEEFTLLINGGMEDALQISERVRAMVERACSPEADASIQRQVTVSIGVARAEKVFTLDQLIEAADQEMYQAKLMGKNRVSPLQVG